MTRALPHRLRRLQWDVHAPAAVNALALRTLLHERSSAVETALDEVLSAHDEPTVVRRIAKLELHLSANSVEALGADLPQRVAAALRQALEVVSGTAEATTRSDQRASWMHYLDSGSLHWSLAGLAPGEIRAALEAAAVEAAERWLAGAAELPASGARSFAARASAFARWLALLPPALRARFDQDARGQSDELRAAFDAAIAQAPAIAVELRALRLALLADADVTSTTLSRWLDGRRSALDDRSCAALERVLATLPRSTGEQPSLPERERKSVGATPPDTAPGMLVPLGGLVLLHPYLPRLFTALQLYDAGARGVLSPVAAQRALALLHWIATGSDQAPEYELTLVKLLLGLPPHEPLVSPLAQTTSLEREEGAALLEAVIGHWPALRHAGIDNLRASFLQRRGLLARRDGGWHLHLQSESYDVLLALLPWSLSPIKLPWIDEPLFVEWPAP